MKIDDGAWSDIPLGVTYTWETALEDGDYTLSLRAVDAAGNPGAVATLDFIIDSVAPTAPANVVITSGGSDTTPTFTWDAATDAASGIESYEVRIGTGAFANAGDVTTYTVADADALAVGSYIFEVRSIDAAGNRSTATSYSFQVSKGGLPVWAIILIVLCAVAGAGAFFWIRRSKKTPDKPDQKRADKSGKKTTEKPDKKTPDESDQKVADESDQNDK